MHEIIDQVINNFDIAYMLSINILTYLVIKVIDYFNKYEKVKLIIKRLVLIICTIICCVVYKFFTNIDTQILINSTIAAPVFYSWIMKPFLQRINIGYRRDV